MAIKSFEITRNKANNVNEERETETPRDRDACNGEEKIIIE